LRLVPRFGTWVVEQIVRPFTKEKTEEARRYRMR
jgi:hypothetical protein